MQPRHVRIVRDDWGVPHILGRTDPDVAYGLAIGETLLGTAEKLGVYADGDNVMMLGGDEAVTVSKAASGAKLVELEGYDPYETLSRKLGWSDPR